MTNEADLKIRELEERLSALTAELQRANEELEQFAYLASHDLQEPLRAVAGFAQLLSKRYKGRLDSDADEIIGFVVDGAERLKALISDLFTFSRVSAEGRTPTPVPAQRPFHRALVDLAHTIEEARAVVTADELPIVMGDEAQLASLFRNLIENSLKFRGPERPIVRVGAERRGDEYVFSLGDNGIGIDPAYAERIFVMFQRLHDRSAYPGTGIGLAICKRIVSRLGGRIWVHSRLGDGATFYFTLRAAVTQSREESGSTDERHRVPTSAAPTRQTPRNFSALSSGGES